jgi:hypothetical protein
MVAQHNNQTTSKGGRGVLITCFVLFAIYFLNVLFGKINIAYSLNLPHLGNLAEFLMLFGACILLIIAALKRETAEKTI